MVEQRLALAMHGCEIDHARQPVGLVPEKDIAGDRKMGDQIQFLIDHRDA